MNSYSDFNANRCMSHIDEFQRSGKRFCQNSVVENTHRLSAFTCKTICRKMLFPYFRTRYHIATHFRAFCERAWPKGAILALDC